jgi:hypothetical protein
MAYFPDLSPYAYGHHAHLGVVHVGWLDNVHHFTHGTVETRLIGKLMLLAAKPVEVYLGLHVCELCLEPPNLRTGTGGFIDPVVWSEWAEQRSGTGEIRVSHRGITFAAPVLIVHYIEEHGYLPPSVFLKAVEEREFAEAEALDVVGLLLRAERLADQKLKAVRYPTKLTFVTDFDTDATDSWREGALGLGLLVHTVPIAAKVGRCIIIVGNNLTGSTSVTFNGTAATFTVESDTYITATVPAGATTGTVSVTTPTGTLNSNPVFQVLK